MHVFLSKCSFWLIHSYVNIRENFFYSWSTTYEDLLCNDEPFLEAIPLSVRISNTHTHTLHPSCIRFSYILDKQILFVDTDVKLIFGICRRW